MKTWAIPQAVAQQFLPNEYVSACYNVMCVSPQNNGHYRYLYMDNGDGAFDAASDTMIYDAQNNPDYPGATHVWGCGCSHLVHVEGELLPTNNGFCSELNHVGSTDAAYIWYGAVTKDSIFELNPGSHRIEDLHITDLNYPNAITEAGNKS